MNKIILIGHLGKDPETSTHGESSLSKFSLATTRHYTANGERMKETQWHNVSVWNSKAIQYLSKGSQVCVMGRVEYKEYEKDGIKRTFTNIVAEELQLLDKAQSSTTSDDLPF